MFKKTISAALAVTVLGISASAFAIPASHANKGGDDHDKIIIQKCLREFPYNDKSKEGVVSLGSDDYKKCIEKKGSWTKEDAEKEKAAAKKEPAKTETKKQ